ncbi:hypothetical protein NE237_024745 [Protea cynaroides]|uniref:Uncharacterized protein n=1 Tax=Protea cynaroides TaxID=273540 RepID=A0A9Q0JYU2_9MAGN|nr:hypothetical protein NE237_024745 [Protea cynaroides]
MPKNNSKMKSSRKPLADISNGGKFSKAVKKNSSDSEVQVVEDDALDRLLCVYSSFSNLIQQLDPLVVQAFKCKLASKKEMKEVESFTNVLSDMHSSIELWIPRFQKVLSSLSVEFDSQLGQSSEASPTAKAELSNDPSSKKQLEIDSQLGQSSEASPTANAELSNVLSSKKQLEIDSHVSPSPLVSWRAECTIENGRQLFLLTPLPRSKAHPSKNRGSSKLAHERNVDTNALSDANLWLPSLFTLGDTNGDLMERVELNPKPNEVTNSTLAQTVAQTVNTQVSGFLSPPRFSHGDQSVFLMTPRFKVSPPKSCVLLEPISETSHQENNAIPKFTPFVVGTEDTTSESSSGEITKSLALKYPELFGPKLTQKLEIGKQVEASPGWFISPPKTCVLMEPPDKRQEHQLTKRSDYHELESTNLGLLESTPLWESERKIQIGKRPGENTLKRELWTKFEAASSSQLHFDASILQGTLQKGFLDRLEEVSIEKTSSSANDL